MALLRILAKGFSILFHPLFMLTYMLVLLLLINPYLFAGVPQLQKNVLVIMVFAITVVIPAFTVLMMKLLGFVETIQLQNRTDRTIPYIATGMYYLWLLVNLNYIKIYPQAFTIFTLGATIGLFIAFLINLFSKISMHGVGMGGLLGMVIITMLFFSYGSFSFSLPVVGVVQMTMTSLLMLVILICGMVGTSRLLLKAHEPEEIYGGFFVGFCTQFLALFFLGAG